MQAAGRLRGLPALRLRTWVIWAACCLLSGVHAQTQCEVGSADLNSVTEDALHASAQCALQMGQPLEAIERLQVLLLRVDYPVYRADLGRALLALQRYEEALVEFDKAMASSPPPDALRVLQHFSNMARQGRSPSGEWQKRVSLGWVTDSNVNTGPSNGLINLFGLDFQLDPSGLPVRAHGVAAELQLSRTFQVSPQWQSALRLSMDSVGYAGQSPYNQQSLSVEWTSAWSLGSGLGGLRFPLGAYSLRRGNDAYQNATWMGVQWHVSAGNDELSAGVQWQRRAQLQTRPMSADQWLGSVAWLHPLGNELALQITGRLGRDSAQDVVFSNRQVGLSTHLSWQLARRWSAKAEYSVQQLRYDAAEAWATDARSERISNVGVQLIWVPQTGPQWTLAVVKQRNRSNVALYDNQRTQLKLSSQWQW